MRCRDWLALEPTIDTWYQEVHRLFHVKMAHHIHLKSNSATVAGGVWGDGEENYKQTRVLGVGFMGVETDKYLRKTIPANGL